MTEIIRSASNARLKALRRLQRSPGEVAILEGPHLLEAALEAGVELLEVWRGETYELPATLADALEAAGATVRVMEDRLLASLADADSPRGLLATAHLPRDDTTLPVGDGTILYLDAVQDPGNLGAMARSAEAAGALALVLGPGSAHPNHPRALRASVGSLLRLPVLRDAAPDDLGPIWGQDATWVALDQEGAEDLWSAGLEDARLVLALGSEGRGLSADLRQRCQRAVRIPLAPPVESLNVTVAASIVLYERRRREWARLSRDSR